eukprot:TRINITY_DN6420_c0_g1_i5.p1 TRINITY_DN6420_c0_g1~~TRINITY_DN6420_c0_g1_i5.p1  ORF type:complete len:295 (-),score=83.76 TRINITY_DN6420_c0_g1_i5:17-811(-)
MENESTKPDDNVKVVEDIIEVDGKKMKRIRKYEKKLVKHFTPKGVLERQKIQPYNTKEMGEASALDKNPVFFVVHGKSKQIKVKVNTLANINQMMQEINQKIHREQIKMKELEEEPEIDFRDRRKFDKPINEDAVVRVGNIPNEMNVHQVRDLFSQYGKIIMMSMPRPFVLTEEEKRFQKRRERLAQKMAKKMAKNNPQKEKEAPKDEEKHPPEETTHRGYAFVYYESYDSAVQAIKDMNEQAYYSQIISVKKAKPRPRYCRFP